MSIMACRDDLALSRRQLLAGGASLALWSLLPRTTLAGTRDPRLLTVVLRGGLDGLALASPAGDPHLEGLRGALAIKRDVGLALDGFFVLNPAMPFLHGLYEKREALIIHAVATPYRERSHFDGQDVLESGLPSVGRYEDGWLNRALAHTQASGRADPKGLSMGAVVPLVMRGRAPVLSWVPKVYNSQIADSTIARLADLYAHTDPALAKAFADGVEIDRVAIGSSASTRATAAEPAGQRPFRPFIVTAEAAARFLSSPDGPRVGALSYNGWDTHANEGAVQGQLANRLGGLDDAIKAFTEGMGPAWKETVVVLVTEFGRTVRANGTEGTDHGTATVALVLGGAVNGGRILADWPGLSHKALYEDRDLAPTRDLRAVLKGVLRDHLGISDRALAESVFPASGKVTALDHLVA
jgi:uncharacterized protein (DUF1501 family)